jgi:hypothetical protein
MISRLGSALKCFKCAPGDIICKDNFEVEDCGEVPHEVEALGGKHVCMNAAIIIDGHMGIKRECIEQCEL